MNNCQLIRDLLPLYIDDVCSEESRQAVEAHLAECEECKKQLEQLSAGETDTEPLKTEYELKKAKSLKKMKKEFTNLRLGLILCILIFDIAIVAAAGIYQMKRTYQLIPADRNMYVTDVSGTLRLVVGDSLVAKTESRVVTAVAGEERDSILFVAAYESLWDKLTAKTITRNGEKYFYMSFNNTIGDGYHGSVTADGYDRIYYYTGDLSLLKDEMYYYELNEAAINDAKIIYRKK